MSLGTTRFVIGTSLITRESTLGGGRKCARPTLTTDVTSATSAVFTLRRL